MPSPPAEVKKLLMFYEFGFLLSRHPPNSNFLFKIFFPNRVYLAGYVVFKIECQTLETAVVVVGSVLNFASLYSNAMESIMPTSDLTTFCTALCWVGSLASSALYSAGGQRGLAGGGL